MGVWGTGIFDNDDAADWALALAEAPDLEFVRQTLELAVKNNEYLDCREGNNAIAASVVIAACRDGG